MRQKKEKKKKNAITRLLWTNMTQRAERKCLKYRLTRIVGGWWEAHRLRPTIFQHFVTLLSHRFGGLFIIVTRLKKKWREIKCF